MLNFNFNLNLTKKDVIDVCEELGLKFDETSKYPIPIFYGSYMVANIFYNNPSAVDCTAWLTYYGGFGGIHTKDVFRKKMTETINEIKKYEIEERIEKINEDFK